MRGDTSTASFTTLKCSTIEWSVIRIIIKVKSNNKSYTILSYATVGFMFQT